MKNLITTFFLFLGIVAFSREKTFDTVSQQLKSASKIDKSDKEVANLLQRFYTEALQSDKGELSNDTPEIINKNVASESNGKKLSTVVVRSVNRLGKFGGYKVVLVN